jgi:hypothetical protein
MSRHPQRFVDSPSPQEAIYSSNSSESTDPNYHLTDEGDDLSGDGVEHDSDCDYLCGVSCGSVSDDAASLTSSDSIEGVIDVKSRLHRLEAGENETIVDGHGWTWTTQPKLRTRGGANLLQHLKPGVTDFARSKISELHPETAFLLFFDIEMRGKIIDSTNKYCNAHLRREVINLLH